VEVVLPKVLWQASPLYLFLRAHALWKAAHMLWKCQLGKANRTSLSGERGMDLEKGLPVGNLILPLHRDDQIRNYTCTNNFSTTSVKIANLENNDRNMTSE
jgi:hypothetical protein